MKDEIRDGDNIISFRFTKDDGSIEVILTLDTSGFVYKGKRIEDAGEAHKVFMETMEYLMRSAREDEAP